MKRNKRNGPPELWTYMHRVGSSKRRGRNGSVRYHAALLSYQQHVDRLSDQSVVVKVGKG